MPPRHVHVHVQCHVPISLQHCESAKRPQHNNGLSSKHLVETLCVQGNLQSIMHIKLGECVPVTRRKEHYSCHFLTTFTQLEFHLKSSQNPHTWFVTTSLSPYEREVCFPRIGQRQSHMGRSLSSSLFTRTFKCMDYIIAVLSLLVQELAFLFLFRWFTYCISPHTCTCTLYM